MSRVQSSWGQVRGQHARLSSVLMHAVISEVIKKKAICTDGKGRKGVSEHSLKYGQNSLEQVYWKFYQS